MTDNAVEALVSRADLALDTMHLASEGLVHLRITRHSADGLVGVTVDSTGAMVGLELAEDLSRQSARKLTESITGVAAAAARDALDQRRRILERMRSSLSAT
ncbi:MULTISPECIES: YbaB/EbfC family nucleoid-associated protein [unclassified Rhodococcus (in: high G+C Gram-positive bacteria)]|uniref:YbaB/EbfC family nucleoid-associated protein n=1 Tax=unclassified Rhodococcus (in: high G+C Gram-positive bacteria) TaxID=192944 RepID=UPI001FF959A7|nr:MULTISPECIES: YbaB/EbfC family nucleoid-associated protein [unclassified Rhodococcus (in: high G+C Gram-positive bacteria)]